MPRDSQYAPVATDEAGGDAGGGPPAPETICGIERRPRQRATMTVCLLSAFIFAFNQGVLMVCIPTLAEDFDTTTEVAGWASMAPMFVSSMIGTQMGFVADRFGRARTWHVGMLLELLAHAACGWSMTMAQLLAGRILGGVGIGIGAGSAFGLMAARMPPKQRGIAHAWMMLMGTLGRSFGMSLGGMIMSAVGWRWVFRGPVPILVAVWIQAYFVMPFDPPKPKAKAAAGKQQPADGLDWGGSITLAALIGFLLLGTNRGNEWGWGSPIILASFLLFAILLPLLILIERRAAQPIVPMVVLSDTVCLRCLTMANMNAINISGFQMMPFALQVTDRLNLVSSAASQRFPGPLRRRRFALSVDCARLVARRGGRADHVPAGHGRSRRLHDVEDHHEAAQPSVPLPYPAGRCYQLALRVGDSLGDGAADLVAAAGVRPAAAGLGVSTRTVLLGPCASFPVSCQHWPLNAPFVLRSFGNFVQNLP